MPVVSNTSPVLNLAIIGQLELLYRQLGQIWISEAVLAELCIDEGLPGTPAIQRALDAGWLTTWQVADRTLVQVLQRNLDKGEAEAIALALERKASRVLLDEREGRQVAKSLGLNVTGVLGVLLRAKRAGILPSLRQAMDELCEQAGFRIAPRLYEELLGASGVL